MKLSGAEHLTQFYEIVRRQRYEGPVLVIYIDGFGYEQYERQKKNGNLPFMGNECLVTSMETIDQTLTNPAYATMITGQLPQVHGVYTHGEHRLFVPSFFGENPEQCMILEGDSLILRTEVMPKLHVGGHGKGVDEAIFEAAKKALERHLECTEKMCQTAYDETAKVSNQLIFAHFHQVDDAGHNFGPDSKEYAIQLHQMDDYVKELCKLMTDKGIVFLISDHGITDTGHGGIHGNPISDREVASEKYVPFGFYRKQLKKTVGNHTGFSLRQIMEVVGRLDEIKDSGQLIIAGEDGFAVACAWEEMDNDEDVLLEYQPGGYRLIFPKENYSRRWCKHIEHI